MFVDLAGRMVNRVSEIESQMKDSNLTDKERLAAGSVQKMTSLFATDESIEVALESASSTPALEVANTLKKWWEQFKKAMAKLYAKIKAFLKNLFGVSKKIESRNEKNLKLYRVM